VLNDVNTVDLRNQALARLAKANPGLQISFTVPCAQSGLIQPEIDLVKSLLKYKVPVAILNPLPFDFGSPVAAGQFGNVVNAAATDVLNQMKSLGLNAGLGITVLIGTNDESDETFLLNDARVVEAFAEKERNVQRLSFWEVSRDNAVVATTQRTWTITTAAASRKETGHSRTSSNPSKEGATTRNNQALDV
jgi:hypothetical protein